MNLKALALALLYLLFAAALLIAGQLYLTRTIPDSYSVRLGQEVGR